MGLIHTERQEIEMERERKRERQTDRQTDRQTEGEGEEGERETEREKESDRQAGRQTDRQRVSESYVSPYLIDGICWCRRGLELYDGVEDVLREGLQVAYRVSAHRLGTGHARGHQRQGGGERQR